MRTGKTLRVIVCRFRTGDDILDCLNEAARENRITAGSFTAIGAAQKASLGYYLGEGQYSSISLQGPLEIVSCIGNVSIKENQPFVHAHITLTDKEGKAYGGHLMPETRVGATFEVTFHAYDDVKLSRKLDQATKLFLLDA